MVDNPAEFYQTMSITTPGPSTLPKGERRSFQKRDLNDCTDIDGAQSKYKTVQYTNKPQFLQSDVPGSQPKQLCRARNTQDNTLFIDDIDGTRPAVKDRMMLTKRHVDPLQPNYSLPAYVPVEPPAPKFIKDPMEVRDIEGTRPKPQKVYETRDILKVDDVAGARSGTKHGLLLKTIHTRDVLECHDISAKNHRYTDRTTRVTDPCDPVYSVHGMTIKNDKYTKPKEPPKYMNGNHLLQTADIQGALADSRYASPFPRREYRNTNFISDIEGAHADSFKHSIVTKRETHPLQPVYQALDPGELLLPLIPPLIPKEMVKVPTLPSLPPASTGIDEEMKLPSSTISAVQRASQAYPSIGQSLAGTKIGKAVGIADRPVSSGGPDAMSTTWGAGNTFGDTPFAMTAQNTFSGYGENNFSFQGHNNNNHQDQQQQQYGNNNNNNNQFDFQNFSFQDTNATKPASGRKSANDLYAIPVPNYSNNNNNNNNNNSARSGSSSSGAGGGASGGVVFGGNFTFQYGEEQAKNTARQQQQLAQKLTEAGNNFYVGVAESFNGPTGGGGGGGGGGGTGKVPKLSFAASPMATGRGGGGNTTGRVSGGNNTPSGRAASQRAVAEKKAEIAMVRDLNW